MYFRVLFSLLVMIFIINAMPNNDAVFHSIVINLFDY